MTSTVFVNGVTLTDEGWFQDANSVSYTLFGNGTSYTGKLTIASADSAILGTTHKWYAFNDATYAYLTNAASGGQEGIRVSTSEVALMTSSVAVLTGSTTEIATSNKMRIANTLAIPAGGTDGQGYSFSSTPNFGVFFGSGAPTMNAAKGSLYLRSDGSGTNDRMYVNTNGGTTWTAVVTVA